MLKRIIVYTLAFAAGISVFFCPFLFGTGHFFGFFVFYGILGVIFGLIYPQGLWRIGIPIGLPLFLMTGPFNFSDNINHFISTVIALKFPLVSCSGAYLGAKLALRFKKRKDRI